MQRLRMTVLAAAAVLAASGATIAAAQDSDTGQPGGQGRTTRATVGKYWGEDIKVGAGQYGLASVSCPAGMVSTGGGGSEGGASANGGDPFVIASYGGPSNWFVGVKNTDSVTRDVNAFVVCMTP
jgi:hypothetical protein